MLRINTRVAVVFTTVIIVSVNSCAHWVSRNRRAGESGSHNYVIYDRTLCCEPNQVLCFAHRTRLKLSVTSRRFLRSRWIFATCYAENQPTRIRTNVLRQRAALTTLGESKVFTSVASKACVDWRWNLIPLLQLQQESWREMEKTFISPMRCLRECLPPFKNTRYPCLAIRPRFENGH